MGVTLVTGATGLVGSHVTRLLVERGDRVRVTVRAELARPSSSRASTSSRSAPTSSTARRSAARCAASRASSTSPGLTSLRAGADTLFRVNVDGTRIVLEEALRAGVERAVLTSSVAAIGPAPRGATADETQVFRAGRFGLPYVSSKHEAENEALRIAAHGLPLVIVNPAHVMGRGDVYRSSTELVRRFLRRQIPAYVDGALNVVDAEDVARGHLLADERGAGRRALHPRQPQLHARPAVRRPRPPVRRRPAGGQAAARGRAPARPRRRGAARHAGRSPSARCARRRSGGPSARRRPSASSGWKPSHHEDTLVDTIEWYRSREPQLMEPPGTRQPLAAAPRRASGCGRPAALLGALRG